ncbi:acyltransferase [Sphaerisporangium flaviroseum]|uniref:Acyltransferase n=2 Tax=Sphaerisporangium flaviroseum TaxID=509199 RepID=A0ABP7HK62_9ACTN
MRFLAALAVFLCHAVFPLTPGNQTPAVPYSDPTLTENLIWFFSPSGTIGLSFFFILSGFVITWSSRPGQRTTAYLRRRLVKVFPNHVVTWALAMLLFAGAYTPLFGLPNLFLVNTYSSNPEYWGGANMPAWSLTVEMLFYLLFPLLIIPIRRIADSRLWLWAGAAVAGMAAICVVTLWLIPDAPRYPGEALSMPQFWFSYMFPPARLMEFIFGMILAQIVMRGRWPRIGLAPVLVLLVIGYAAALTVPSPFMLFLVTAVPFGLAIGTYASRNLDGVRTVMGSRPMVWLGNVSFGFFMTQGVVLFWLRPTVIGEASYGLLGGTVLLIGLIAINIVAGWLLFKLVEQPTMRHWSRSKKPVATVPQVPVGAVEQEVPSPKVPV